MCAAGEAIGTAYDPWRHAEEIEIAVEHRKLPPRRRGQYIHDERLILLSERLGRVQERCTLAHELGHAVAGDTPTVFGPLHARQERRARRCAASWLITREDYERCALMFDGDARLMARELDVTVEVLRDYARWVETAA